MSKTRADQDSPWKEILRQYFPEAIVFFFPNTYVSTDTELHFRFNIAKLLDYNDRLTALEDSTNPFATVVLAHLQTQSTRKNSPQRKENKLTLTRRLYEKGFDRQDIISLFRFIDWVMILEPEEEQEFWQTLKSYEEERRMPYITTVERIGYESGLKEGVQQGIEQGLQQGVRQGVRQGLQEGQRSFLIRLLKRRVGELPEALQTQIEDLSLEAIVQLGEDLLDFTQLADLEHWLTQNAIVSVTDT